MISLITWHGRCKKPLYQKKEKKKEKRVIGVRTEQGLIWYKYILSEEIFRLKGASKQTASFMFTPSVRLICLLTNLASSYSHSIPQEYISEVLSILHWFIK